MPSPPISTRAAELLEDSSKSPFLAAVGRTFANPWDDDNPDGIINAGIAENSLLHDWLIEFWEREGTLQLKHSDLTYGKSILGSDRMFSALGQLYTAYFNPLKPVEHRHIVTSNGLSSLIAHIAAATSDAGDEWLIPAPYYYGFNHDLKATSQVGIAKVQIPSDKVGTIAEVEALDAEMRRRKAEGSATKITTVLLTNPHNPLGFSYPRQVILEYLRLAERWSLFLVVDEIYALSVFDSPDYPSPVPFTSVLSIDALVEAQCDPSRVIQLYGIAKDFGANGLRAGVAVVQHNERLVAALATKGMEFRMGSPTDALWSALLISPELETYLSLNRAALSRAYTFFTAWLRAQKLPYTPAHAGHFVVVDWREYVNRLTPEKNQDSKFAKEFAFLEKLVDSGVYLGPGFSYSVDTPGYFRVTFSLRRHELELALQRIEKACGIPAKAVELSRQYPA